MGCGLQMEGSTCPPHTSLVKCVQINLPFRDPEDSPLAKGLGPFLGYELFLSFWITELKFVIYGFPQGRSNHLGPSGVEYTAWNHTHIFPDRKVP